jgi:ATP-dependent DNA helicase RecG
MKSPEKGRVMADFAANKANILVATSVIEVGIDFPNATIMAIEDADRFGLAQLYQFRGRVGRGTHQSVCLLFTANKSAISRERLHALTTAKNGFELAEKDLALRGPGEFFGRAQTGMPDIAMKALNNAELVKAARDAAARLLAEDKNLTQNPILNERLSEFRKAVHLEQGPVQTAF